MAKFTISLEDQPKRKWTTRQQRAWIREATRAINKEFYEMSIAGVDLQKDHPLLYEERNRLIKLGTGKEYKGGVGLGLTYKTKSELMLQARELKSALRMISGEVVTADEESSFKQGYETFTQRYKDFELTFEDYKDMSEVLGALGEHVINNFKNSDNVINAYNDARKQGQSHADIMKTIIQTNREVKGEGLTTEQMVTRLRKNLGL